MREFPVESTYDGRYDPSAPNQAPCSAPFDCPVTAHYYGRGIKQSTAFYNYADFSAEYLGEYQTLVNTPDLVASRGYLALASGLWFMMTPQPPKPSMHDVLIGSYRPKETAKGVRVDADGSVLDKFAATVSIINGGLECSPLDLVAQKRSANRFTAYKALLEYLGATLTQVESSYVPGVTYCMIDQGDAFADPALIYNPQYYLDTVDKTCRAITYQATPPLMIAPEGNLSACEQMPK
jgi:hypothetical protein